MARQLDHRLRLDHFEDRCDDPHLSLVLVVLHGIREPEQRAAWMQRRLPRTYAMLDASENWERLGRDRSDG